MRTSNPALSPNIFQGYRSLAASDRMTVQGAVNKTFILLAIALVPAFWTWSRFYASGGNPAAVTPFLAAGTVIGFITAMVTVFKKEWAPTSAPIYALAEGFVLGGVSSLFEASYPGIVIQAVGLTLATLSALLFAYKSGLIQVTDNFRMGVFAATAGIALFYFLSFILSFFGMPLSFIQGNGVMGIGFSLFVVGIAALNLVLDFDFIEQGERAGAPKYMEWYAAFGVMVTLIWLYLEILRLLAKLRGDRR